MKSVGIDIGTNQVKVVEIQTLSRGYQVVRAIVKNLSRAVGTDLELEIIEFLREISAQFDPTTTRFVVGLRQDRVALRYKVFPFAERQRIQKTLPFELEEELPFTTDNAIFEGKIIRILGNTSELLAAAVPKVHIATLLNLMKDSAIEPTLITTEGMAFANLFENWAEPIPSLPAAPPALEDTVAGSENVVSRPIRVVLNMGHSHTLVCAFDGDLLVGVRSLSWGGRLIIEAIAQKYSLPVSEAQKEMEGKAFILTNSQSAPPDAKMLSDLIAGVVYELVRDLQLSLLEFRSEFGGEITQIQMSGGVSAIQGLGPFLTQSLEVPVNRLAILDLVPNVTFERSENFNLTLGVAIGLAMEGLRKPRNPSLNFMRGEFARQTSFFKDLWKDWGVVAQGAAIATLLLMIWSYGRGIVAQDLDDQSAELLRTQAKVVAKLPTKQANEAGVKRFIKDNRKKIADSHLVEALAGMNSAMDVVSKVTSAIPDGKTLPLDVTELIIDDADAHIAGSVNGGQPLVDRLNKSLANIAIGNHVGIDSVQTLGTKTAFRMNFKVDRNLQTPGKVTR